MNENDLNHLLAKIEALVKAAETFKETSNHMVSTLAKAIKQQQKAVIAEEELKKGERVIATANCAQPDISHISTELFRRISNDVTNSLESSIKYTIANTLKNAVIPVEHTHVVERNLKDVVDKRMTKTIAILLVVINVIITAIGISIFSYFDGDTYWGKQFYGVYTSEYLTLEEKADLKENSFPISILPPNYYEDTAVARLQIKQMKEELKKREKNNKKKNKVSWCPSNLRLWDDSEKNRVMPIRKEKTVR